MAPFLKSAHIYIYIYILAGLSYMDVDYHGPDIIHAIGMIYKFNQFSCIRHRIKT